MWLSSDLWALAEIEDINYDLLVQLAHWRLNRIMFNCFLKKMIIRIFLLVVGQNVELQQTCCCSTLPEEVKDGLIT